MSITLNPIMMGKKRFSQKLFCVFFSFPKKILIKNTSLLGKISFYDFLSFFFSYLPKKYIMPFLFYLNPFLLRCFNNLSFPFSFSIKKKRRKKKQNQKRLL